MSCFTARRYLRCGHNDEKKKKDEKGGGSYNMSFGDDEYK
jgi:hypothetical protein